MDRLRNVKGAGMYLDLVRRTPECTKSPLRIPRNVSAELAADVDRENSLRYAVLQDLVQVVHASSSVIEFGTGLVSSPVCILPPAVWKEIFFQADLVDGVMLALTCKALLTMACYFKLQVPELWKHKSLVGKNSFGANKASHDTMEACECGQLEEIIRRYRPTFQKRRRLHTKWNICIDCSSLRPTRMAHWHMKLQTDIARETREMEGREISIRETEEYRDGIIAFWRRSSEQCPGCRLAFYRLYEMHDEDE
ncbi:hypothetical protein PT974_04328 [Cladobotryum mycophilum]|uniref:F-box domain-containing protein n=1 Tax=Cladobotryum mycophilum TaxID=491253 RepID=A0ABR0SUV4_9HYPO